MVKTFVVYGFLNSFQPPNTDYCGEIKVVLFFLSTAKVYHQVRVRQALHLQIETQFVQEVSSLETDLNYLVHPNQSCREILSAN